MLYSLLQNSLTQTLDRATLEEASTVVRSVARADCAKLQRELFGILVSGLPLDEATAFQAELKHLGFPTTLVADDDLPILHSPFTVQRIERIGEILNFTDALGRIQTRPLTELVFLGGGFLKTLEMEVQRTTRLEMNSSSQGSYPVPVTHRETHLRSAPRFILDFFFSQDPHRLQVILKPDNVMFYQGAPLRLKHPQEIVTAMAELRKLLPPDRLSSALFRNDPTPAYPNLPSYEEEIRWKFHQLMGRRKN